MWNFNSADSSLPGQVDELARLTQKKYKLYPNALCFSFFSKKHIIKDSELCVLSSQGLSSEIRRVG